MFKKTELDKFFIISFKSVLAYSLLILVLAVFLFFTMFGMYDSLIASSLHDPKLMLGVGIIGAIANLYFCFVLWNFVFKKYQESQIIINSKLKGFSVLRDINSPKKTREQKIYLNILIEYYRKLGVFKNDPLSDDLNTLTQLSLAKYNKDESGFLNLVENDPDISNLSMLDFVNLKFSPEQERKINDSLIMSSMV
ncbi:hypothetical protein A7M79_00585 [Acinetobacter baumannii]|uniref:hypothetical protein n=1 Tax=Acinetobacter baumannii TaxID=470 RepID=UPI0008DC8F33|nr:hypothetical protein [Acinetobacter baumannii]OIH12020.1 hypothetical protein A7M79_00585 [Acinetobacter baumannii]